jgi:MOSC domain-containing protein YiiM
MPAAIASLQVGKIRTEGDSQAKQSMNRRWTTAFYKFPVTGPLMIHRLGVTDDEIADKRFHGGIDKAVLGYSADNYPKWRDELIATDFVDPSEYLASFGPGAFAENLTIAGQDETDVCIGDRYRIGDDYTEAVDLEVSQPRQPCWKISRRWQHKTLTKKVADTGRTGWYFRVLKDGRVQLDDSIHLLERPHPNWTIARANDVLLGRETDRFAVMELMALEVLSADWKASLS